MSKCPFCEKECTEDSNFATAIINGTISASRDVTGRIASRVTRCVDHGVMRIANVYTDKYMEKVYPDLELRDGGWFPKRPRSITEAVTLPDVNAGIEDWENCSRAELINVIDVQRAKLAEYQIKIAELEASIVIKGWWCMHCDIFNGEEKDKWNECRNCSKPKTARPPRVP